MVRVARTHGTRGSTPICCVHHLSAHFCSHQQATPRDLHTAKRSRDDGGGAEPIDAIELMEPKRAESDVADNTRDCESGARRNSCGAARMRAYAQPLRTGAMWTHRVRRWRKSRRQRRAAAGAAVGSSPRDSHTQIDDRLRSGTRTELRGDPHRGLVETQISTREWRHSPGHGWLHQGGQRHAALIGGPLPSALPRTGTRWPFSAGRSIKRLRNPSRRLSIASRSVDALAQLLARLEVQGIPRGRGSRRRLCAPEGAAGAGPARGAVQHAGPQAMPRCVA